MGDAYANGVKLLSFILILVISCRKLCKSMQIYANLCRYHVSTSQYLVHTRVQWSSTGTTVNWSFNPFVFFLFSFFSLSVYSFCSWILHVSMNWKFKAKQCNAMQSNWVLPRCIQKTTHVQNWRKMIDIQHLGTNLKHTVVQRYSLKRQPNSNSAERLNSYCRVL